jgi:hypothetical protein
MLVDKFLCQSVIIIVLMEEDAICFIGVDLDFDDGCVRGGCTDECAARIKTALTELHY